MGSFSNIFWTHNFNHPCKELVFVVQPDANVDYCSSFLSGTHLNRALGAQPFNYTDALDALTNTIAAFSGPVGVYGPDGNSAFIDQAAGGLFQDGGADSLEKGFQWGDGGIGKTNTQGLNVSCTVGDYKVPFPSSPYGDSGVSDAGAFVLAETALNMHCWGQNPVVTAKLQLNGQDRFSEREGTYFDLVQPYQHHTRNPDTGINVYSFALRPEEHQPSGTCNMSRIDNATLQLVLSTNAIGGDATAKVRVYATNYNVLRVMSGMGGLAYSN